MKKYLGFLVVLSILTFGGIKVEATNDIGCDGGTMYSPITGQRCDNYNYSFEVLSPNGGEVYNAGQQVIVKWKSTGYSYDSKVSISLATLVPENDGPNSTQFINLTNLKNDGIEVITLPSNIPTANNYAIVLIVSDPWKQDISNNTFTIKNSNDINPLPVVSNGCSAGSIYSPTTGQLCSNSIAPFFSVISPNGGEVYQAGQQISVTWENYNLDRNYPATIELFMYSSADPESFSSVLINTTNDGYEIITLPTKDSWRDMFFGNKFKIRITIENFSGNTVAQDFSDNLFTINSSNNDIAPISDSPSITVLSPNGGEVYNAGQQIPIRWSTINIPANAKIVPILRYIDNSYDEANTTSSISLDPVLNTGSALITLPTSVLIKSGKYYGVRLVYEISTPELGAYIGDRSDDLFTINFKNPNEIAPYETAPAIINNEGCVKGALYSLTTGLKCPTALAVPTATANSNLMKGVVSNEVKTVQSALTKQGYTLTTDGKFGPKTEEAVKKFQSMKGLPVTGIIDDTTMSMILSYILGL